MKTDNELLPKKKKGDGEIIPRKLTPQPTTAPGRLDD